MSVFASLHEAHSFLEQNPDIEMFELFILDNNGVPARQVAASRRTAGGI